MSPKEQELLIAIFAQNYYKKNPKEKEVLINS
jgi:hypothetical protein